MFEQTDLYEEVQRVMTKPRKEQYHHGDLAPVIMRLAIEEIAEYGTENLSLRALARKADVSQTAPYRHFPTKTDLLAALATQGFEDLLQRLKIVAEGPLPIQERLLETGVVYVEFAVENPVVYQLMFGRVVADFSEHKELRDAAQNCFKELQSNLKALMAEKDLDLPVQQLGGVVWSGIHGIAALLTRVRPTDYGNKVGSRDATAAVSRDIRGSLQMLFGHLVE